MFKVRFLFFILGFGIFFSFSSPLFVICVHLYDKSEAHVEKICLYDSEDEVHINFDEGIVNKNICLKDLPYVNSQYLYKYDFKPYYITKYCHCDVNDLNIDKNLYLIRSLRLLI